MYGAFITFAVYGRRQAYGGRRAALPHVKTKNETMMDFILCHAWQSWAIVTVVLLITELHSGTFYMMCTAVGALCALLSSFVFGIYGQLLFFAAGTAASIAFVRPVALRLLGRKGGDKPSGVDALIGRTGRVSQTIVSGGYGRVQIDGDDWKASSVTGEEIAEGRRVEVVSIESVIITVRPADK